MTSKRVGLVIGNNYPNSKQELLFAVADALAMKEVLLNKDICGFDEVEESINDTFVDVRIKIEKILKNANHEDLVLIYFSGHGKNIWTMGYVCYSRIQEKITLLQHH